MATMTRYIYIFFIFSSIVLGQKNNEEDAIRHYYTIYKDNADSDLDKAYIGARKAYDLSKNINNENWRAKAAYARGYCYYLYEKDSVSEVYLDEAINYAKKINDRAILAKALNVKGSIYSYKNKNKKALEYFHESIKYSEKSAKLSNNTANVLNNIADIYVTQQDTINAKKYYHEAVKIQRKNKLDKSLSNTYNSLGVLFMDTNKDSALYYINQSLTLALNNKLEYDLVNRYLNIGVIYLNFNDADNYDKAKYNLIKALEFAEKNKMTRYKFQGNLYLGIYYKKAKQNFIKSKHYFEKALSFIDQNKDQEYNLALYKELAEVYHSLSDFEKAFVFKDLENNLKDRISNLEKSKQIHEIQTKFDVERKDFQINLLHLQRKNQKIENRWTIIVSLISISGLLGFGIIYRSREKKRHLVEQQQNDIKRMQDVVKTQDNERNRIAKELHDGVGNKLSVIKNILHQKTFSEKDVDDLKSGTKDLMKEIREISHNLSISIIVQKGPMELITELVETFKQKTSIKTEFVFYPQEAFDFLNEEQKMHLYRVFQEALHNIEKHANAYNVSITVTKREKRLIIVLEDDGNGFDVTQKSPGIGILNMKERMQLIKGSLIIDSALGNGTTIIIELDEK